MPVKWAAASCCSRTKAAIPSTGSSPLSKTSTKVVSRSVASRWVFTASGFPPLDLENRGRLVAPRAFGYGRQLSRRAKGAEMAFSRNRRGGIGGISVAGVLVIVGIVVALAWSLLLGIIIAVIGLV